MRSELMTAGEAARLLSLTPAGVHAVERRGELKAERTAGGVRIFRRQDVERLAAERAARRAARGRRDEVKSPPG